MKGKKQKAESGAKTGAAKTVPTRTRSRKKATDGPKTPRNQSFPIAGIGASAGGLDALGLFLEALPECIPEMAFVVVSHLDAGPASIQKRLLPLFHYSLKPGGILFLGTSETIGQFSNLFTTLDNRWKLFGRAPGASSQIYSWDFPVNPPKPALESSKEELRSVNEEYQSSNEELQSANEELHSSKDELQSLNEELETVNSELQGKVKQIENAYDEMAGMLNSLGLPAIFLDSQLRIRRFSAQAREIFDLIESDLGRPLEQLSSRLEGVNLGEESRKMLDTHMTRLVKEVKIGKYARM